MHRCKICGQRTVPDEWTGRDFWAYCPTCDDHLYECSWCGNTYDDRVTGEPETIPPNYNSPDGLGEIICPGCYNTDDPRA